jgi:DMSO/TMAO reductase YedYZ heme-binding membrane subunit
MSKVDRRTASWCVALVLLVLLPAAGGFTGLGWELAQFAGWAATLACLALCGLPVRPRTSVPPTLLSLRQHTLIGWWALGAAALHAVVLVVSDRTVIEYLKPTAPVYQLAGIAALVLLVVLVVASRADTRRRLWASHRGFQASHVILGCALAALLAVHVIVTRRYVGNLGTRGWYVVVSIGALLMLLRARRPAGAGDATHHGLRRLVFGRHSRLVFGVVLVCAAAIAGLSGNRAASALREPLAARSERIPLDFPHGKHVAVNCLVCHHNYADGSGGDSCIACHASPRQDLKMGIEARFHSFCFECHRHPTAGLEHHGPVSGCRSCHHLADAGP